MRAQTTRRAMRRKVVFVRIDLPSEFQCVAVAPPILDVGGDCEFTCAQCGKVLVIATRAQLAELAISCQSCDAFNVLGMNGEKV